MQVADKTQGDVINFKDNVLDLERSDLEDPVISISMGIRWLSYKYSAIPKNNDKNLFNTLRGYYDWQKVNLMRKKFWIFIISLFVSNLEFSGRFYV